MKQKHPLSKSSSVAVGFFTNLITILTPSLIVWVAAMHLSAFLGGIAIGLTCFAVTYFIPKIHQGFSYLRWKWKESQTAWWIYGFTTTNASGALVHVVGTFQVVDPGPSAELIITGQSREFEKGASGHQLRPRIDWRATFAAGALLHDDFLIIYEVTHDHTGVGYRHGLFWLFHPNQNVGHPLDNFITDFHTGRVQSIDQQLHFDHAFAARISRKVSHEFPKDAPNNHVDAFLKNHSPAIVVWLEQQRAMKHE